MKAVWQVEVLKVEEGGAVTGRVRRAGDGDDRWLQWRTRERSYSWGRPFLEVEKGPGKGLTGYGRGTSSGSLRSALWRASAAARMQRRTSASSSSAPLKTTAEYERDARAAVDALHADPDATNLGRNRSRAAGAKAPAKGAGRKPRR